MTAALQLTGREIKNQNFIGQNLRGVDLSKSVFVACCFDKADLTDANCQGSRFPGSTMRGTICYRTNFRDAQLPYIFEPEDAYGMTITLACATFKGVQVSQMMWYCWLLFATQMTPAKLPVKEPIKDMLIAMIGTERFVKLSQKFARREL